MSPAQKRVAEECPGPDGQADRGRKNPERGLGQRSPERQVPAVVHVEGGQEKNVGRPFPSRAGAPNSARDDAAPTGRRWHRRRTGRRGRRAASPRTSGRSPAPPWSPRPRRAPNSRCRPPMGGGPCAWGSALRQRPPRRRSAPPGHEWRSTPGTASSPRGAVYRPRSKDDRSPAMLFVPAAPAPDRCPAVDRRHGVFHAPPVDPPRGPPWPPLCILRAWPKLPLAPSGAPPDMPVRAPGGS